MIAIRKRIATRIIIGAPRDVGRPGSLRHVAVAVVAVLALLFLWRIVASWLSGESPVLVTGYCNCEQCCGWELDELGKPVYAYGPMKGKPKEVGRTACGTTARRGTVAADPKVFPFGTRLEIPGYGTGVVEDVGGAIKGRHVDVWFPTHAEAVGWGRRELAVKRLK